MVERNQVDRRYFSDVQAMHLDLWVDLCADDGCAWEELVGYRAGRSGPGRNLEA